MELRALVTRVGVLAYRRADGTMVRELRHPDQVFRADSLASLSAAPVTVGHPGDGQTWVDPQNAQQLEVGYVRDAKPEGEYVDSALSVRRADAIRRIDSRELVEVSAAYDCAIDPTPGEYNGEKYDQQQINITYNHVALLPIGKGRAGRNVRLRVDSDDAEIADDSAPPILAPEPPTPEETRVMTLRKIRVDGVEYELAETAASLLERTVQERDRAITERDDARRGRDEQQRRADSAEAERDVARGQLDPQALSARVAARVELERTASAVLGQSRRFDSLSDRDIRVQVLQQVSPGFKVEGRSEDAIASAFDYAVQATRGQNQGLRQLQGAPAPEQRADAREEQQSEVDKQLQQLEQERLNAWKKGRA